MDWISRSLFCKATEWLTIAHLLLSRTRCTCTCSYIVYLSTLDMYITDHILGFVHLRYRLPGGQFRAPYWTGLFVGSIGFADQSLISL